MMYTDNDTKEQNLPLGLKGDSEPDITRKTTQGVVWSFIGHGVNKGFTLLTLMILAHLLTKDDFGLVAVAAIVLNFLSVYKDMGLGNALIQCKEEVQKAAYSVFTLNIILGLTLTVSVYLMAPAVSNYFESPSITPLLRCLGVSFFINAFGSVHIVLLKKELNYRKKFLVDMGGAVTKGIVSITMALTGFGVWSIVIGQLLGQVITVVLVWIVLPWRPRLLVDRKISAKLLKFGASIIGIGSITALTENLAFIIAGKVCGLALLGVFSLSYRLPEVLLLGNLWVLAGVFFSMFSMLQDQPEKLAKGFLATIRLVSMVATPISLGLLIVADPLIRVIYGAQWVEAIPVLKILAVYAWVHSIGFHAGDVYKAIGKPHILLILSILSALVDLTALLIGAQYGLTGIATALLVAMIINNGVNLVVAVKLIRVSIKNIVGELQSSLIAGLVLLVLSLLLYQVVEKSSPLVQLISLSTFGASGYLGILWLLEGQNILFVASKFGVPQSWLKRFGYIAE